MGFLDGIKKIFGSKPAEPKPKEVNVIKPSPTAQEKKSLEIKICSPCDGKVVAQADIPDPTFAEGHMGSGLGIEPTSDNFFVYMNGVMVVLYKTKHAYFIQDPESKISVMLHIGINTVEIEESKQAFVTDREVNQTTKIGEPLCVANLKVIKEEEKSIITALLVQTENMENKKVVFHKNAGDVIKAGDLLMTLTDK